MSIYVQVLLILGVIIALVLIYHKSDKSEELLVLKLIGYYFLGSFRFNIGQFAIPIGFLIYLVAFHPKTNISFKRYAAVLGLIIFILGVAVPKYNDYLFTRPIEVEAQSVNLFDESFNAGWTRIKETLEIDDASVNNFQVDFDRDGMIRSLRYEMVGTQNVGLVHYDIDLSTQKKVYVIRRSKIQQWIQFSSLVRADAFFDLADAIDFQNILPQNQYPWYSVQIRGNVNGYDEKSNVNFEVLSKQGIQSINEKKLPLKGLTLTLFGMAPTSETSASSQEAKHYILTW